MVESLRRQELLVMNRTISSKCFVCNLLIEVSMLQTTSKIIKTQEEKI